MLDSLGYHQNIREKPVPQVPEILKAIPPARVQEMQRNLAKIWHRWARL